MYTFRYSQWILLGLGVLFSGISIFISIEAFKNIIDVFWVATILAIGFDGTKISLSILVPYLRFKAHHEKTDSTLNSTRILLTRTLRIGLVFLSLFCSVLLLSNQAYQPHLKLFQDKDLSQIQIEFDRKLDELNKDRKAELASTEVRYTKRINQAEKRLESSDREIERLRGEIRKQEQILSPTGEHQGVRYNSYDRQLDAEITRRREMRTEEWQAATVARENEHLSVQRHYTKQHKLLNEQYQDRLAAIKNGSAYINDGRLENQTISKLRRILHDVVGIDTSNVGILFFIALAIAVLIELSILVCGEIISELRSHDARNFIDLIKTTSDVDAKLSTQSTVDKKNFAFAMREVDRLFKKYRI